MSDKSNWLNNLRWQVEFYQRSTRKNRTDPEFPWETLDDGIGRKQRALRELVKLGLQMLGRQSPGLVESLKWLDDKADALWVSRSFLVDDLSKLLFDSTLVLRLTGCDQFYFPRIDFVDFVEVLKERPFEHKELPTTYIGSPLKQYEVNLTYLSEPVRLNLISCASTLGLMNSYRQYCIRRGTVDFTPQRGETVLDCGACIGDTSLMFAGLVGAQGQVHSFDPVPLHVRFCRLQASINPELTHVLHINQLAVDKNTENKSGDKLDSDQVSPGGLCVNGFDSTRLDDYCLGKLDRVDFIKMDVEGYELNALEGAAEVIRRHRPKLAISTYHKPEDFWELPLKIKALNPDYELYFGHHSPIPWESVIYAIQR